MSGVAHAVHGGQEGPLVSGVAHAVHGGQEEFGSMLANLVDGRFFSTLERFSCLVPSYPVKEEVTRGVKREVRGEGDVECIDVSSDDDDEDSAEDNAVTYEQLRKKVKLMEHDKRLEASKRAAIKAEMPSPKRLKVEPFDMDFKAARRASREQVKLKYRLKPSCSTDTVVLD